MGNSQDAIHLISGVVSDLHHGFLEYVNPEKPSDNHSLAYYQRFYIANFYLGSKAIEAKFSTPMKIQNGDFVSVAGYQKNKRFQVLAYRNQTQELMGAENWVILALGAIFFLAIALGLLNSELVNEGDLVAKLFLWGFVLLAGYMAYRALLIRKAIGILRP